jgi:hypothetical protein
MMQNHLPGKIYTEVIASISFHLSFSCVIWCYPCCPPPPHTHTSTLRTSITAEIIGGVKSPIINDTAVKFWLQSEHQTLCQPFSLPSCDTFVAAATGKLSPLPRYSVGTAKFRCNQVIMFCMSFSSACTKLFLCTAILQPFLLPHQVGTIFTLLLV